MWQHPDQIPHCQLFYGMRFHFQAGRSDKPCKQEQRGDEIGDVDLQVQAEPNDEKGDGAAPNHVDACLEFGKQQDKCQKGTDHAAQEKKEQLRKPVDGNAFCDEHKGQGHLHDQWDFSLVEIGKHDAVYFPKGPQQIEKGHGQEKSDDDNLENQ